MLKNLGFEQDRQAGTSHEQWEHPCFEGQRRLVTVSQHLEPFHRELLKNMRNQVGLSKRDLMKCLVDERYAKRMGERNAPPAAVLESNR
ncbi:type II toxin-antitoxin system HicA family toxin [Halomonas alkalisoli]|uniref:type II toxin-antitoxin system HicA family toxin n=1 Tax=Halomonas alkalisoli TaxID=2907158 RepID=UPI0034E1B935